MPDHSSEADPAQSRAQLREEVHIPRTDWRLGGRTVLRWRERLLAIALLSLGLGIVAGAVVQWLWPSKWAAASATALLWVGMLVPIVWGLTRSRPAGLLRFRALDVLYGVALAGILRVIQGWVEQAMTDRVAFPSYPLVNGRLSGNWWLTDAVAVIGVAPMLEEFYFRAVILIAIYTILRKPFGGRIAGLSAVIVSAAFFMLMHGVTLGMPLHIALVTGLLGLVCATLVVLTGRIWGAVLVHVLFNVTYVALALTGTFLV